MHTGSVELGWLVHHMPYQSVAGGFRRLGIGVKIDAEELGLRPDVLISLRKKWVTVFISPILNPARSIGVQPERHACSVALLWCLVWTRCGRSPTWHLKHTLSPRASKRFMSERPRQ